MRPRHNLIAFCVLLVLPALLAADPEPAASEDGVEVFMSPGGGCAEAVIRRIGAAQQTVDIMVYSVTHAGIAESIRDAQRRGVAVRVVLDRTQAAGRYSSATFLHNAGVPVWTDAAAGAMHHKACIIDGEIVLTGSFNWTQAADRSNAENLVIITRRPKVAAAFKTEFERVLDKAKRYERVNE